jgi:hypothetical protein
MTAGWRSIRSSSRTTRYVDEGSLALRLLDEERLFRRQSLKTMGAMFVETASAWGEEDRGTHFSAERVELQHC